MNLEERLMHSLSSPQTRDVLEQSVEAALRKVGWSEDELPQATRMLMKKLSSYPAIDNGADDKAHTTDKDQ